MVMVPRTYPSNRKTTQMVTPTPGIGLDRLLNQILTVDTSDFSFSSADPKAILKNHILLSQKMGNLCEWNKYRVKRGVLFVTKKKRGYPKQYLKVPWYFFSHYNVKICIYYKVYCQKINETQ